MKRRRRGAILSLILAVSLLAATAAAAEETGRLFLWRLTSPEGGRGFLAGSIHLAAPDLYPLPAPFDRAFAEADRLAVEIDTEALTLSDIDGFIAGHGLAAPGRTLNDYLTPATSQALTRSGFNRPEYARFRPWLAALSVQVEALAANGFSARYGLDKYFLERAVERRLPIVELETFDEQLKPLAELNEEEADLFLRAALMEARQLPEVMADFCKFWSQGDVKAFAELFFDDLRRYPELSGLMFRLITRRNRLMAERLRPILAEPGGSVFVIVGAGHLVGEESLLTLLTAQNFKVEQLPD